MDISLRTWAAAVRIGVVVSVLAAAVAVASTAFGDVPHAAIVLPVIVVGFVSSWVHTGRARRAEVPVRAVAPRTPVPIA